MQLCAISLSIKPESPKSIIVLIISSGVGSGFNFFKIFLPLRLIEYRKTCPFSVNISCGKNPLLTILCSVSITYNKTRQELTVIHQLIDTANSYNMKIWKNVAEIDRLTCLEDVLKEAAKILNLQAAHRMHLKSHYLHA